MIAILVYFACVIVCLGAYCYAEARRIVWLQYVTLLATLAISFIIVELVT